MSNVVSINEYRPHISGEARCIHCSHEWVAVVPSGTVRLECPECSLLKGALVHTCYPKEYWECDCGNDLFMVSPSGVLCAKCGVWQEGY